MRRELDHPALEREIVQLRTRFDALRQSAAIPGAELPRLLEAAFDELDGAIELAAALQADAAGRSCRRSAVRCLGR